MYYVPGAFIPAAGLRLLEGRNFNDSDVVEFDGDKDTTATKWPQGSAKHWHKEKGRARLDLSTQPNSVPLSTDEPGVEALLGDGERVFGLDASEEVEDARDEARPPRLVAGAEAGAVVAVEVLVEEDQVAPVRVPLELLRPAVNGSPAALVLEEDVRQPA